MLLQNAFTSLKTSYRRQLAGWSLLLLALLGAACGGAPPPESESLSEIVAPTPTPTPPPPTRAATVAPPADPASTAESSRLTLSEAPTATPEPPNPQTGDLTVWMDLIPPPGWQIAQGVNGLLVAKEPANMPQEPFVLVRRWSNQVALDAWVAYLPDGIEERNSDVVIRISGIEWDGVFISNESSDYRAFFAVARKEVPAYSLLVYVPTAAAVGVDDRRAALLEAWEANVIELNSILNRLDFSY